MLPIADDCDECLPSYLQQGSSLSGLFSYLPFILTFFAVITLVSHKLLPLLDTYTGHNTKQEHGHARPDKERRGVPWLGAPTTRIDSRRLASLACAVTIALSAVLVELLLCEIVELLDKSVRSTALRVTLVSLMASITILVPALEIYSTVGSCLGLARRGSGDRRGRGIQATLSFIVLLVWLAGFWYLPYLSLLPDEVGKASEAGDRTSRFLKACLKRIGIIGIALMAVLAGFAAVSAIWQTLGARKRVVKDTDIARKQTGLESVQSMLETKQSRLRAVEQRMTQQSPPRQGFLARVAGTIKGDGDAQERKALELEIAGLETMASALESSLADLRATHAAQQRSNSTLGRALDTASLVFALYCIYRTATITHSTARRLLYPSRAPSPSDPISNLLALLTAHYDATLDRDAWARQISFAMSGVILLLSFSAVLQTFRIFSRLVPSLLQRANAGLALVVAQVAGTYVISSALLLRSNLPPHVRGVITDALGAPLEPGFADAWFEGWFLVAVALTALGVGASRRFGDRDWDDEGDELEMGKMS